MKKQIMEPDFIGGQGSLTKDEEAALSIFFAKKSNKIVKKTTPSLVKIKPRKLEHA
jgi:hypothetical protein